LAWKNSLSLANCAGITYKDLALPFLLYRWLHLFYLPTLIDAVPLTKNPRLFLMYLALTDTDFYASNETPVPGGRRLYLKEGK